MIARFSLAAPLLLLLLGGAAAAQTSPCQSVVNGHASPPAIWSESAEGYVEATRLRIADRFPMCVYAEPLVRDLDVTLLFQPRGGRMDRAGGLAVRVRDADTYYVLRASAAENSVSLSHVIAGRRVIFASRERVFIALGFWHRLRLRLAGEQFSVWFDDWPMFEAHDSSITEAGRVALWSASDSDTLFDTPRVEVLR